LFDDYTGVVLSTDEGKRIAVALGEAKAVILRNHGLLNVGHSVDEAVWWFITMERTCQAQLLADAAGPTVKIDPEMAAITQTQVGGHLAGWLSFQPSSRTIERLTGLSNRDAAWHPGRGNRSKPVDDPPTRRSRSEMSASMSRSADRLRSSGEGPRQARPTTPGHKETTMPKYLLLKHCRGGPEPHRPVPPMDQWAPEDVEAHMAFLKHVSELLEENGEYVDAQALTPARTWVRYGGPDAAPVTTDGPLPETSDLVAGWYMIDVESHERAVELAAYVSSEPGPGGEPLYEWIDVREVMSDAPSEG